MEIHVDHILDSEYGGLKNKCKHHFRCICRRSSWKSLKFKSIWSLALRYRYSKGLPGHVFGWSELELSISSPKYSTQTQPNQPEVGFWFSGLYISKPSLDLFIFLFFWYKRISFKQPQPITQPSKPTPYKKRLYYVLTISSLLLCTIMPFRGQYPYYMDKKS